MNIIIAPFIVAIFIFAIISMIGFWLWSLVDCIKSNKKPENKLMWILLIIILNILGAILYFLFKEYELDETKNSKTKRLTKSSKDKVLLGVCGGLAKHTKIDSSIIRILFVLITIFFNGIGILIYVLAALIMPQDKQSKQKANKEEKVDRFALKFFVTIFVLVSIFISMIIAGGIIYSTFSEVVHEQKQIINEPFQHVTQIQILEKIKNSPNYQNFGGENLRLLEIEKPDRSTCTRFQRDIATIISYDSNCYLYHFKFDVTNHTDTKYYDVSVLVIRGEIKNIIFSYDDEKNQKIYCDNEEIDFCIEVYDPVCGFKENQSQTFTNQCFACKENVKYYVMGEC